MKYPSRSKRSLSMYFKKKYRTILKHHASWWAKRFTISMLRSAVWLRYTTEIIQLYSWAETWRAFNDISWIHVSQYANPYNIFGTIFFTLPQFYKAPHYLPCWARWGDRRRNHLWLLFSRTTRPCWWRWR